LFKGSFTDIGENVAITRHCKMTRNKLLLKLKQFNVTLLSQAFIYCYHVNC